MKKKVLEEGRFDFKPFEKNAAINFIALTRKNLEKVKPGMYWYEDDTVSEQFTSAKKLKSLVLFVKNELIYGDTFKQRYILESKIDAYFRELKNDFFREFGSGRIYRPSAEDLQEVYANFAHINAKIKPLKKLRWSEGLFWAKEPKTQKPSFIDMFDGEELDASNDGAYIRPMLTLSVK